MRDQWKRHDAEHTRQFRLKYNKRTDAQLIAKLEEILAQGGSVQGYIRNLILEDIKKGTP